LASIALKVDVDTLRGTQQGVPRLLAQLQRHRVRATFLFSLGPDHTGWALRRVFRPGFLSKVSRTSVLSHYGWRTLMYGVLLPAPDIGRRARGAMVEALRQGHECGIHTWDHVPWQDQVRRRDADWTRRQMALAWERYAEIFGQQPGTHGAAGWQMNETALQQIDDWGLSHASDGRGTGPYRPSVGGRALRHVQYPTTLPTLDEIIGHGGVDEGNAERALLALTGSDRDQVYTLHAELEGGLLGPVFERLLQGWKAQGHSLLPLADLHRAQKTGADELPVLPLRWGSVAGRSGELVRAGPG
jgi:peptidoglycan/xylan/chitin deacetylase (PgdA/CDA1 family)